MHIFVLEEEVQHTYERSGQVLHYSIEIADILQKLCQEKRVKNIWQSNQTKCNYFDLTCYIWSASRPIHNLNADKFLAQIKV